MSSPRIAIIGAGPAGLCFAAILQRNGIQCTIYEGENSSVARDQGGTLDLHPGTGQAALEAAGLLEQFRKCARPEGEATKLVMADGSILWDDNARPSTGDANTPSVAQPSIDRGRPEIDRTVLRELLLSAVNPDSIKWQHKVQAVHPDTPSAGVATIEFASGNSAGPFDLIVGADGAWSRARSVLTDVVPSYSGITGVELWAHNAATKHPWLDTYAGAGSMYMFDDGRAVITQRQGSGDVRAYAAVRVPETWKEECGIDWNAESAREELIKSQYSDVAEDLKNAIREAGDKIIVRALYHLPIDHEWTSHGQVTALGDAAHLMTPFAGVGVNMALADAKDLAENVLAECRENSKGGESAPNDRFASAIASYETNMYPRAHAAAKKTAHGLVMHFSKEGGLERAEKFKQHALMKEEARAEALKKGPLEM